MRRSNTVIDFQKLPFFAPLPPALWPVLRKACVVYTLAHREPLFNQGDLAHSIYVIADGGLQLVEQTHGGHEVKLKVHGVGDVLGLLAISGPYPYPSRAESVGSSSIVGISGEAARAAMLAYPEFALHVIDHLVTHVHHAHSRVRHMMVERVDQRVARALLHYCEKFGRQTVEDGQACISIDVTLSQQDIAQFTGATVETVNRILKGWQNSGWIRLSRQHIEILNCPALAAVAEDQVFAEE